MSEIGRAISELLQNVDSFFPRQLLLVLAQAEIHKLYLAFLVGLELGLVRVVILLHIFIVNFDLFIEIGGVKSNDVYVEFVIGALKIFVELAFGNRNARRQEPLDLIEAKLIANKLLDMLFAQAHRAQDGPNKLTELVHVEARFALKTRQLANHICDFRTVWTKTEPLCFVAQDQQVNNELDRALVLVRRGPSRQCLDELRHADRLRQAE